ncbi:hypothetical protein UFOVP784_99 [uncultured Caudovirales phage]|uniref:Uncharacterized protein n=1 Tax=uncultured Caudovirales phage TaxID=2100421 RepID=A0A6J5M9A0_9CAUD|nr:hypothetical protein UFOVP436_99 [uncultured Caudovirales phage]CAB4162719.1 hypothetical protein UFOVP784_99 [uncultured Caudovirales phage]
MAFASVSNEDKLIALNAAKLEFERDIYKNLAKLGIDADNYDLNSFEFDESVSTEETDPDYNYKKHVHGLITRLNTVKAKIVELS